MKIDAMALRDAASRAGFRLVSGVPCSYLQPVIDAFSLPGAWRYVPAANEGDAVAVAAGATVGGSPSIALFQNSGLGNAVNPLSSLHHTMRIPTLLLITHRGEPGGAPDEPQHDLMGQITEAQLDLLQIPHRRLPSPDRLEEALADAAATLRTRRRPIAWLVSKGDVEAGPPPAAPPAPAVFADAPPPRRAREPVLTRTEALDAVRSALRPTDVVVATTGYTGRALYAQGDSPRNFYMVGSMGCASSFGLGLALARPERRVLVLDGDGALLMRLGALAAVGWMQPPNLIHVALDNACHASTGGQATATSFVDLAAFAAAGGYRHVERCEDGSALRAALTRSAAGPTFLHVPIRAGVEGPLPRPSIAPPDVTERLARWLQETA